MIILVAAQIIIIISNKVINPFITMKTAFAIACFFAAAFAEELVLIDDFSDFTVEDRLGMEKFVRSDSEIWTDGQI